MKNKLFILILIVCNLLTAYVSGEVPPAKVVFQQYMNQAQTFANNFPREKAYLHFDNTSYYVGDTIWFKAYVTLAEQQTFSQISRPLYVELVDQTGHIADKQIIKLTQGEGNGQFILPIMLMRVSCSYLSSISLQNWKKETEGTSSSSNTMHLSTLEKAHFCERYSEGSQPKFFS